MMWLGITVLALMFAGVFTATARVEGVKVAFVIWGVGLIWAAVILVGVCLATGVIG